MAGNIEKIRDALAKGDAVSANQTFNLCSKTQEGKRGNFRGYVVHRVKCLFSSSYKKNLIEQRHYMLTELKGPLGMSDDDVSEVNKSIDRGQGRNYKKFMRKAMIKTCKQAAAEPAGRQETVAKVGGRVQKREDMDFFKASSCLHLRKKKSGHGPLNITASTCEAVLFCTHVQDEIKRKTDELYEEAFGLDENKKVNLEPLCHVVGTCENDDIIDSLFDMMDISKNNEIKQNITFMVTSDNVITTHKFHGSDSRSDEPTLHDDLYAKLDDYKLSIRVPSKKLVKAYCALDEKVRAANDGSGADGLEARVSKDALDRMMSDVEDEDDLELANDELEWLIDSYADYHGIVT